MMEEIDSFEMSVLTRVTRRNIPEDGILPKQYYSEYVQVEFRQN
jgi:hypothetical protein